MSIRTKLSFAEVKEGDATPFIGKLFLVSLSDAEGNLICTDADLPELLDIDATTAENLMSEIMSFNGMNMKEKDTKKN